MSIEWDLVIKIAVPLGTLLLGKYLDRWLAKRPKLISYLVHASAFTIRGENQGVIHTHAIVVRNAGREAASNVRIGHYILPDQYQLFPAVPHTVERDPSGAGAAEIVIPQLVPGEQVTVSYLYTPPLLSNQINAYTNRTQVLPGY